MSRLPRPPASPLPRHASRQSGGAARSRPASRRAWAAAAALTAAVLAGCGGGGGSTATSTEATATIASAAAPAVAMPTAADRVAVGEKLFNEVLLSAGGRQACSSCHVKTRGHADPEGTFLPLGGPALDRPGMRSSPTLNYLDDNRAFRFNGQGEAVGGFTWDGRAADRAAQAQGPLLAANEMANADAAAVVRTVRALPYFAELGFAYSLPASATEAQVMAATQQALADYQAGDADYHLFTSKFDAVQDGRATFTAQEARGLAAFNDPRVGNCASCHDSTPAPGQTRALFTNFRYFALGAPRNTSSATADPAFFDLGLCGPTRTDLSHRNDLCGMFKVPTLRNVALTAPYFHNGVLSSLQEVVAFYATRDSDPARWYPTVAGVVQTFNDLPPAHRGNVTQQAPFGGAPRITPQQVQDIVAFLGTLSDGFTP